MSYDMEYAEMRKAYRREVGRTLTEIENGGIDELDLAKLRNFCMTALMLMTKVQAPVWRKAERDAELAGLLHDTGG